MKKSWSEADFTLREARVEVRKWLAAEELDHLSQDVSLIVTELLTNASEANEAGEPLDLELDRGDGVVLVAVSNRGGDFLRKGSMPPASSLRGRGLAIVDALSTSLEVQSDGRILTIYAVVSI